jgi:hypothetical protein
VSIFKGYPLAARWPFNIFTYRPPGRWPFYMHPVDDVVVPMLFKWALNFASPTPCRWIVFGNIA